MATARIVYKDGRVEMQYDCGTSVYKGKLYIWNPGTRKGKKPRKVINLSEINTKKSTGSKGIFLSK